MSHLVLPSGFMMNPISPPQTYVDERKNSSIVVDAGVTMELTGIKMGMLNLCVAMIKRAKKLAATTLALFSLLASIVSLF